MSEFIYSFISYLNNIISVYYFYSLFLYFIILILFFTFSLPGGLIVLIASGFFFGFIQGFFINIISISLGSLFFIIFSKNLLSKMFNKYYLKFSNKLSGYIKNTSIEYLILVRLFIGPPLAFQNICISLLNVSKMKIFLTTIIGFIPQMLLFSYIGSYISNIIELQSIVFSEIFSKEILFTFGLLIFLILLRIYFKK